MASLPVSQGGHYKRRQNNRRQALARTNTLLGAIKNIVTAPLSWFASTNDFEEPRDSTGKRRRLVTAPTEPALDEGDETPRVKRMRVDSPPRELRREGAYLDPPPVVFEQSTSIGRSVFTDAQATAPKVPALGINGNSIRSNLSPLRNLSATRTMSIDPPPRPQSRDGIILQSRRTLNTNQDMDSSMESIHPPPPASASSALSFPRTSLSVPRDLSMPYSRPPFRMRTSLTPQPSQVLRERSEPPPLQMLRAQPTFVKPPPPDRESRTGSIEPGPTLGSLLDSVRRSPVRHQSSLLFGGKTQTAANSEISRAQKALHELEIYKTPLLPTRLRNDPGQSSITGVPDLFKPRRKLVLMKDEVRIADRTLGRKEMVSPDKNDTKPYAGYGGMKRMLAKRKLELEDAEESEGPSRKPEKVEEQNDEDMETEKIESLSSLPKGIPPPKDDWYSLASAPSSGTGGSSLRVGRAKLSRNHISRPMARSRGKFSAIHEEGDDVMLDEDKEREMLEEAAKKVPAWNVPASFSFAKDVKPIDYDTLNTEEPPIRSLPFSFNSSAALIGPVLEQTELALSPQPPQLPPTTTTPLLGVPASITAQEKEVSLHGSSPATTYQPTEESKGAIPNFFSRSAAFNKPLNIKTPPLAFSSQPTGPPKVEVSAPASSPAPTPLFSSAISPGNDTPNVGSNAMRPFGSPVTGAPVKDTTNPLWNGEKKAQELKNDDPQLATNSIFGTSAQGKQVEGAGNSGPVTSSTDTRPTNAGVSTSTQPFLSLFGNAQVAPSTSASSNASANMTVSFGISEKEMKAKEEAATPFTFGPLSTHVASEKARPLTFSTPSSPVPPPVSTANAGGNTASDVAELLQIKRSITPPRSISIQPPPSLLGAQTTTSIPGSSATPNNITALFGVSEKETKAKVEGPTPFIFGQPSTPVAAEKIAPLTFSAPSSPVPPPVFTTNTGEDTIGNVSKPLQIGRPVTPPKNTEQEFQMDESPTREIQQTSVDNKPLTSFNFVNSSSTNSLLFGGPTSAPPATTTPFPFGSNSSNLFTAPPMKESKSEGPRPFIFGQSSAPAASTTFIFGQGTQNQESPRSSTGGSFGFGTGAGTTPSATSGFNFTSTGSNSFAQRSSGSAPSSPLTFQPQPSPFGFGGTSPGTGFNFGSQPASPAAGNTNLPQAAPVTFGSGNTGFGSSAPSSPFSAPSQIAPSTSSGGTLFTIGAAPPPQPTQGRAIKKLPNRSRIKR